MTIKINNTPVLQLDDDCGTLEADIGDQWVHPHGFRVIASREMELPDDIEKLVNLNVFITRRVDETDHLIVVPCVIQKVQFDHSRVSSNIRVFRWDHVSGEEFATQVATIYAPKIHTIYVP